MAGDVQVARPSVHCFDPHEPHAHLCQAMVRGLEQPDRRLPLTGTVVEHGHGHAVPGADARAVQAVLAFMRARAGEDAA